MRVAFLTTVLPSGRRTGSELASQAFVDAVRAGGAEVDVLGYRRPDDHADAPGELVAGVRPIETEGAGGRSVAAWLARSALRREPFSTAKYRSTAYREMAAALAERADVVVLDHAQMAWVVDALPSRPMAVVAHNVEADVYRDLQAATSGLRRLVYRREARLVGLLERRIATEASQVWAIAADDAAQLRRLSPHGDVRLFHLPGRAVAAPADVERSVDVAVLGTWSWAPNAEGLRWFCDEVLPHLDGVDVHVAGGGADWLGAVAGVRYHGRVPDADAFLSAARVVAIPSTAGSGVQIKTLDALSLGSWVVATPVALRGLDVGPDVVRVAQEPRAFAAAVRDLLADDATTGPCTAALAWAEPRRERLVADVADALADLAGTG